MARQFYEEQLVQHWPGLAREVEEICEKLSIQSVNSSGLDAKQFRKVVTNACHAENKILLRRHSENIGKCKTIKGEGYENSNIKKEKLYIARKIFKSRYGMTDFASKGGVKKNIFFIHILWIIVLIR